MTYYIEEKDTNICLNRPHSFDTKLLFDSEEEARQHLINIGEDINNYNIIKSEKY